VASAGLVTVAPHGRVSLPVAASAVSSLTVMTDLRLVRPVTTASGKVGGLVGVGVGASEGDGEADGVPSGVGEGVGVGPGPRQPARNTTEATSAMPRRRDAWVVTDSIVVAARLDSPTGRHGG